MTRPTILIIALLAVLFMAAGCGGEQAEEQAAPAESAATETAAETATTVATHDCDGGCGMKDVAVDKMTEIDGKFYCAGCAKKAEAKSDHPHDDG